jgi:hypothetical protein
MPAFSADKEDETRMQTYIMNPVPSILKSELPLWLQSVTTETTPAAPPSRVSITVPKPSPNALPHGFTPPPTLITLINILLCGLSLMWPKLIVAPTLVSRVRLVSPDWRLVVISARCVQPLRAPCGIFRAAFVRCIPSWRAGVRSRVTLL